jgi:hypothetical protein
MGISRPHLSPGCVMRHTVRSRSIGRLMSIVVVTLCIAACDATPTSPPANRPVRAPSTAHRDLSDTLKCLSGYIVVGGEVICN